MHFAFTPAQSEFPCHLRAARQTVDPTTPPAGEAIITRSSLGRRALRGLARLLILFPIGVGATLGWQSYGNVAQSENCELVDKAWLVGTATRDRCGDRSRYRGASPGRDGFIR